MVPLIAWQSGTRKKFEFKDARELRTASDGGPSGRP
jgi:hypothetical protein